MRVGGWKYIMKSLLVDFVCHIQVGDVSGSTRISPCNNKAQVLVRFSAMAEYMRALYVAPSPYCLHDVMMIAASTTARSPSSA